MTTPLSTTVKIVILLVLAVIFASSLVALSLRTPENESHAFVFGRQSEKYTHTFNVVSGGTLKLDTDLGDVTVTTADVSTVDVIVDVRGDRDEMDDFKVKFSESENAVQVLGRLRHSGWNFGWNDLHVRYEVVVPEKFDVRLETSGGDISVSGLTGFIRAETSGGDVTLSTHEGDAQIETSGGDIRIYDTHGMLRSETSGGDIRGERITGSVHAETSGGDITLKEVSGKTVASTSGGNVRLEMLDNQGVDASTSGGDITITLPEETPADIYAEANSGDVSCDFAIKGRLDEGTLEGEINGGGKRVRAETSGGDISIRHSR